MNLLHNQRRSLISVKEIDSMDALYAEPLPPMDLSDDAAPTGQDPESPWKPSRHAVYSRCGE
jgi:hypothetical protein